MLIVYPKFKDGVLRLTLYHELTRKFSFIIIGLISHCCVPVVTDALYRLRSTCLLPRLFSNIKTVLIRPRFVHNLSTLFGFRGPEQYDSATGVSSFFFNLFFFLLLSSFFIFFFFFFFFFFSWDRGTKNRVRLWEFVCLWGNQKT